MKTEKMYFLRGIGDDNYRYCFIFSISRGYCFAEREYFSDGINYDWKQTTKWYKRAGNLEKFNSGYNPKDCAVKVID